MKIVIEIWCKDWHEQDFDVDVDLDWLMANIQAIKEFKDHYEVRNCRAQDLTGAWVK